MRPLRKENICSDFVIKKVGFQGFLGAYKFRSLIHEKGHVKTEGDPPQLIEPLKKGETTKNKRPSEERPARPSEQPSPLLLRPVKCGAAPPTPSAEPICQICSWESARAWDAAARRVQSPVKNTQHEKYKEIRM